MKAAVVVLLALAGCLDSGTRDCGNGYVCPQGLQCVKLPEPALMACVTDDQATACNGLPDGTKCADSPAATCHAGACFVDVCGNGLQDASEMCDDGNTLSDDGCSANCASTERCPNGVIDQGEQCDPGDAISHDGCTSSCQFETLQWTLLRDEVPSSRYGAASAFDADRGAIVVFGGYDGANESRIPIPDDTMFNWDGIRWRRDQPLTQPSPRGEHAMAYDSFRKELVLFGGSTNQGQTWTAKGTSWTLRNTVTHPIADARPEMVYEASKRRVIMVYNSGTWAWDGTDWRQLPQSDMETTRGFASLAYDPKRGVVVMFGGQVPSLGMLVNDTWELEGDIWVKKAATTPPSPRMRAAAAYSPTTNNGEVVIVGGYNGVSNLRDAYSWNGSRWASLGDAPTSVLGVDEPARYGWASGATDPSRQRAVFLTRGAVVELDGNKWITPLTTFGVPSATPPAVSGSNAVASDPRNHRIVIVGGQRYFGAGAAEVFDDTWVWDGQWTAVAGPGTGLYGASLVYDPREDEYVLFGGCQITPSPPLDKTWTLKLADGQAVWTERATTGLKPPGRCMASMVYDTATGNTLLFGGRDNGTGKDDFWIWNGTTKTWSQSTATPRPSARYSAASGYDPIHHELVVFSGLSPTGAVDDAWTWNGSTWTKLTTPAPTARIEAQMAWDAARKRLVMVGGYSSSDTLLEDVWELDGATHTWEYLPVSPDVRTGHALVSSFDERAGVVRVNGRTASGFTTELMLLSHVAGAAYETCRSRDADGDALISCDDPDCWTTCTPFCPPGTDCTGLPVLCGNNMMDMGLEQCTTCPADWGSCPSTCGDFTCDAALGETQANCPADCTP